MFYWKYIDLDPEVISNIQQTYKKFLPRNDHFFQTLNIGTDSFLDMPVQRFVLIQVSPKAVGRIHTDFRPSEFGDQLALQIPLENCEDSITHMWESDYDPPVQYTSNNQPYRFFEPTRCKPVTSFKLTRPVIFRTDIPHSVDNPGLTTRKAISIRFVNDPWHLLGDEIE